MYLLLLRIRRNTVGFQFDSLCNVPPIMGQGRSWVQHRKIHVQASVLGGRCTQVPQEQEEHCQVRQN